MELRAKEDEREEQSQSANSTRILHVVNKMELREEWLRGQVYPLARGDTE
jgi:hypothetical protein